MLHLQLEVIIKLNVCNCLNCNKELTKIQILKGGSFCSKSCATTYRQNSNDPNFFLTLNDDSIYYLCGLIYSDGNLSKDFKKLSIGLTDYELIEKIYPYFCDVNKRKIYITNKKQYKPFYTIINTNKNVIGRLIEMGITPNKSCKVLFPNITDKNNTLSFIRGYFDGDGCIYISNKVKGKKYYAVSFTCGSYDFIIGLQEVLTSFNIRCSITQDVRYKNKKNGCYYLKIYSQPSIWLFYKLLYNNEPYFFLKRKREAFN